MSHTHIDDLKPQSNRISKQLVYACVSATIANDLFNKARLYGVGVIVFNCAYIDTDDINLIILPTRYELVH